MRKSKQLTSFNLPVTTFQEGKYFIAHTPLLNFSVQGSSLDEVMERFVEGVSLLFEEMEEMGTTAEVLEELGWQRIDQDWQPPEVTLSTKTVKVPLLAA